MRALMSTTTTTRTTTTTTTVAASSTVFARTRRGVSRARRSSASSASVTSDVDAGGGGRTHRAEEDAVAKRRATLAAVTSGEEISLLLDAMPTRVREALREDARRLELTEVVLDLGRFPTARFPDGDATIGEERVTYEDLERMMEKVGDVGRDNRAGINGR